MIKVEDTNLKNVKLVKPNVFEDFRGEYIMTYNEEQYSNQIGGIHFIEDDISVSSRHVLRGLHGDAKTWKLVSCLYGKFYLVVVNCDKDSSEYGIWQAFTLSDRNRYQVLIPPKHGNGHVVLSEKAIFHYKQSESYQGAENQFTYKWNNTEFNIWWPIKNPIISQRDEVV